MSNAIPLLQNPPSITTVTGINTTQDNTNTALKEYCNQINQNAIGTKELEDSISDSKEIALSENTLPTSYIVTKDDLSKIIEIDVTGGAVTVLFPDTGTINEGFNFGIIDPNGTVNGTNKITSDANGEVIGVPGGDLATQDYTNPYVYRFYYWNDVKWLIIGAVN